MGHSEKEVCIKCEKGVEVLACADSDCPVAVHERCMGCPVRFDEMGRFYCPYCLYKNAVAKVRQARVHCLSKKKALDTFLDKEMIGTNKEVPLLVSNSTCERLDEPLPEQKSDVPQNSRGQQCVVGQQMQPSTAAGAGSMPSDHTSNKATEADFTVLETGNRVRVSEIQEVGEHQLQKSVEDHNRKNNISNSRVAEEEKLGNEQLVQEETERNSVEVAGEQMTGVYQAASTVQQHQKGKRRVEMGDSTHVESTPVSTHHKSGQQVDKVKDEPMSNSSRRLTRTSASLSNGNGAGQMVQVKQPTMQLPIILPTGKRRRVLWSREEEEMLEEGVKKFSTKVNKNIPWRKILELGSHVFDQTRNPTDLKDKWKNICSKYGGSV